MGLTCPRWFNDDARQAWREVLAEMDRRELEIPDAFQSGLMIYCTHHASLIQDMKRLAELDTAQAGVPSSHTLSFIQARARRVAQKNMRESLAMANKLASLFFLSPADRIRIHYIPPHLRPRRPARRRGTAA